MVRRAEPDEHGYITMGLNVRIPLEIHEAIEKARRLDGRSRRHYIMHLVFKDLQDKELTDREHWE